MHAKDSGAEDSRLPKLDKVFIVSFCQKWRIREFSLFGSILREDFRSDSDVDVLVEFENGSGWSLFDLVDITDELKAKLGREVHLVEKDGLRNPYRRREILDHREVIYVA